MKIDKTKTATGAATVTAKTNPLETAVNTTETTTVTKTTKSTTAPSASASPAMVLPIAPMRINWRGKGAGQESETETETASVSVAVISADPELEAVSAPTTVPAPRSNPPTTSGRSFAFDAPYRFHDVKTGVQTAFLEITGRLHIRDDQGSLEVWEHARYFIVDCLKSNPAKTPDAMLNQLWEVFGPPQMVRPEKTSRRMPTETGHKINQPQSGAQQDTKPNSDADTGAEPESEGYDDMANARTKTVHMMGKSEGRQSGSGKTSPTATSPKAKHAPATKRAPATNKVKAEARDCGCGCGDKCGSAKSNFLPGHDARFHGQLKKYVRGDIKFGELNETVQKHIRKEGIKQEAK